MRNLFIAEDAAAQGDVNLTPMLDVVFILLIFFIVTASFIREVGMDVSRSDTRNTEPTAATSILITIAEDNGIWINDRLIDPRAARANIERLHAENPEASVVIQAHKKSATRTLVQLMDASRLAGIYNFSLAAEQI